MTDARLPDSCTTFVDVLHHWEALQADRILYRLLKSGELATPPATLSYGGLGRQSRAIGALLQQEAKPGDRAILLFAPGLEFITAFFGCLGAGIIAVPAYPPDPSRLHKTLPRLQAIIDDAQATLVLTSRAILSMASALFPYAPELARLRWLATDDLDLAGGDGWRPEGVKPENVAFLQYTSGSTSQPKGVMISHGNLIDNSRFICAAFHHDHDLVGVGWLPLYHDMGLIGHVLQPLFMGGESNLMSPLAFLQRPLRWLQAISHFRATTSGGPNFAFDLCQRRISPEDRDRLDLSSWTLAYNGAEPVRWESMERFADYFGCVGFRREAFYPCYGLAESTLIAAGGSKSEPPRRLSLDAAALEGHRIRLDVDGRGLVSCGRGRAEDKLIIVDPVLNVVCPSDTVGEIWLASASVALGYWNKSELTESTFQAFLADTGEGPWLRTGDLGFLHEGVLYVTGRFKDLIIIRGRNYYPQDIEASVESCHPSIKPGCSAAFSLDTGEGEQLAVAAEVDPDRGSEQPNAVVQRIRRAVTRDHGLKVHRVVLLKPRSIPKTSSGKIQRHACRAGYLAATLDVLFEGEGA